MNDSATVIHIVRLPVMVGSGHHVVRDNGFVTGDVGPAACR